MYSRCNMTLSILERVYCNLEPQKQYSQAAFCAHLIEHIIPMVYDHAINKKIH